MLEWVVPSGGFNVNEGFEDPVMGELHKLVPFMQRLTGFNRDKRRAEALIVWDSLMYLLRQRDAVGGGELAMMDNACGDNGKRRKRRGRKSRKQWEVVGRTWQGVFLHVLLCLKFEFSSFASIMVSVYFFFIYVLWSMNRVC